jgi:hypothetical protein
MSSHAGSQNLPFFAPSCLRSTYATDNPIPIKDRMASERPGSPLRHLSMSWCHSRLFADSECLGSSCIVPAARRQLRLEIRSAAAHRAQWCFDLVNEAAGIESKTRLDAEVRR